MAFDLPDLSPATTVAVIDKNSSKVRKRMAGGGDRVRAATAMTSSSGRKGHQHFPPLCIVQAIAVFAGNPACWQRACVCACVCVWEVGSTNCTHAFVAGTEQ